MVNRVSYAYFSRILHLFYFISEQRMFDFFAYITIVCHISRNNCHTPAKHSSESHRDKPMPIPRKTQQPKPDQQAVEESIYDLPSLPGDPLHTKNEDTQQAHEYDQPRKLCNGIGWC